MKYRLFIVACTTSLFMQGAPDPHANTDNFFLQVQEEIRRSIHAQAALGNRPALEEMLSAGRDVNERTPESGTTPLMSAAYRGNGDICLLLIEHGGRISPVDKNGESAREYAQKGGYDLDILLTPTHKITPDENAAQASAADTPMFRSPSQSDLDETVDATAARQLIKELKITSNQCVEQAQAPENTPSSQGSTDRTLSRKSIYREHTPTIPPKIAKKGSKFDVLMAALQQLKIPCCCSSGALSPNN